MRLRKLWEKEGKGLLAVYPLPSDLVVSLHHPEQLADSMPKKIQSLNNLPLAKLAEKAQYIGRAEPRLDMRYIYTRLTCFPLFLNPTLRAS